MKRILIFSIIALVGMTSSLFAECLPGNALEFDGMNDYVVTNWSGGKIFPVDLADYDGRDLQAVAANKKVHAELLSLLR